MPAAVHPYAPMRNGWDRIGPEGETRNLYPATAFTPPTELQAATHLKAGFDC